jgi:amino acid adenylation domain-containing protein
MLRDVRPLDAGDLVSLLRGRAAERAAGGFTFLESDGSEVALGWAELDARARAVGAALQSRGLAGQPVLVLHSTGPDYVASIFGCLYAGAIAVAAAPPDPTRLQRSLPRLRAVLAASRARCALTSEAVESMAGLLAEQEPAARGLTWLASDTLPRAATGGWRPPAADASTPAFLHITGAGAGVLLTHGDLLASARIVGEAFGHSAASSIVSWMAPYGDIGLVAGVVEPLRLGCPAALLSPHEVLRRPASWLELVSRHRATTSAGTTFAFDLCARKVSIEERAGLDLSRWQVVFGDAEPMDQGAVDRFAAAFADCGFRARDFYACAGAGAARVLARPARLAIAVEGGAARPVDAIAAPRPARLATRTDELEPGAVPLTPSQTGLWFLHRYSPDTSEYNIATAFVIRSRLDVAAFRRSLQILQERHGGLRIAFGSRDGLPHFRVLPEAELPLTCEDASTWDDATCRLRLDEEAHRPFDLEAGPPRRCFLFSRSDREHLFLLVMHHLLADLGTFAALADELSQIYEALSRGRPAPGLPPAPDLRDYVRWQADMLAGEGERLWAFWKKQLAGPIPVLELSSGRRPAALPHPGGSHAFSLSREVTEALRDLARREGTTLYTVLLSVLQTLLHRYTGQEDIWIGSPMSCRTRPHQARLVGYLVNPVILRGDLSGNPTFADLLARNWPVVLDALAHQEFPFPWLIERLQPSRDPGRPPLHQVMFVLQQSPAREGMATFAVGEAGARMELGGLQLESLPLEHRHAQFDLTVTFAEQDGVLRGSLKYSRAIFDADSIRDVAAHFARLAEAAASDPHRRLRALPLLSRDEAATLMEPSRAWQTTDGEQALHRRFEARASQAPDAEAVSCGTERMTYAELDALSNALARHLVSLGIVRGDRVGLFLDRSIDAVVAILAIVKAGAAYVPIDPVHPDERARFMLADCEARALVTDTARAGTLAGSAPVLVDVGDWQRIARHERGRLDVEVTGDDLAYVIYTSGSTGTPKGVAVTHANVARLFDATAHWFGFDASDVWTLFHSLAFDFSVWELWGALLHGGRLVVVPYLVSRSPEAFLDLLDGERVTVLNQTPSAFRQLIHAEGESGARDLALRHVIFGGEALAFASLAPWFERHGDRTPRLVNMYGITETTVHVTYRPISIEDTRAPASCIGQPIPDLSLHILDGDLQPVPTGVAGELVVGGAGVARGYVNRPELTRERFIPDPHRPGGRLYRSGDLARRLPDGDIEYLGRIDDQVKIRGFRIELGEIESALAAHPGVREVAVLAVGDAAERRLAAYVVARDPGSVGAGDLQAFLADRLPAYMVPAAWGFLPALPVTGNGKVDRRALPVPDDARPDLQAAFAAPRTRAERALALTWSEVLTRDQVGLDDNFFHLGGDSIRALQVVARARRRGLELTIQQLFTHQTVRALAEKLGQADEVVPTNPPFSLLSESDRARLPDGAVDAYPLSTLLAGLLFHAEYGADYEAYLTSLLLRGSFRADALERALARLVERHPILRSAFDLYSFSEPLHIVYAGAAIPVELHDLRCVPDPEAAFDAWLSARRRVRPSWMAAPLARVHVHLLSPDTFRLTLYEPFLDGWSASAVWSELLRSYLAASAGELPAAPPPAISYGDFVALERRTATSAESRAFWSRQLDGVEPLRIPRWPAAGGARARHAEYLFDVPRDTFDGVKRLVRQAGLPLKAALVAAHVRVVALLSGRRDVVTGCLQNGRPEAEGGDEVLGMFLNTVPIRQRLPGGTWLDLVRSVFEAEKACLPHRRHPLALLQKDLNGGQPFFDTACNFTQFHLLDHLKELDGIDVLDIRATDQTYFFWTTTYNVDVDGSHLRVVLDGNGPTAEQMDAIRGSYLTVLAAMARDPAGRYDDDAALLADEQRLIAGWNRTESDFPDQAALHQLFEAQVEAAPGAIAARAGEQALTYRDLNALANRMAHFLVEQGVGPEEIVPISARRGLDLLAAMVAVNKAGGAFLPVDPHSPPQRLARTIAACSARLFIADSAQRAAAEQALAEIDAERRPRLVDLDELWRIDRPSHNLPARGGPNSLAYVMFTSGSTGVPKGAMVEQRGMINHLFAKNRDLDFGPGDVLGQTAAQSFDIFVYQNLAPLVAGGRAQIVADDDVLAAELLLDEVRAHGITVLNIVPSQLRALVGEAARSPAGAAALASLRWMMPTGEPLPPELCREWFALAPDRPLLNAYGHTECSDDQAHHAMTQAPAGETTPIGRPIQNLRFHVLGGDLRPMPIGVPGELYIGGVGVGRGYLGDPARTAEKFVPDPFAPSPGARLYRTGDLGRWLPGGILDVLGRSDFMIKIRGHRVELGEIEAALARHPAVREVVAAVREDTPGRKQLVAYVVGRGQPPDPAELRAAMRAELPEHMVPSAFVSLDALPLNRNGKVDRKALPAPRQDSRPLEPPRGATEELLAGIFAQVLSAPALDRDDGFFELGGDSLLATQVIARVRAAFAVRLGVRDLFETPSIAGFAQRIEGARGQLTDGEAALVRDPARDPVASFAQRRLWFLAQLDPASASYNIPVALRIEGELDRSALERSWAELVRRHAALRTTFADKDGEPVPVVASSSSIATADAPITVDDLSGLAPDERERECRRRLAEEAARPFDLGAGPLARMRLVRLADGDHVLSLVAHHIISDGWSAAVLVREMAALYQASGRGTAFELPALVADYTDYAAWQRAALLGGALEREVDHWRGALDGAPAKLELPTDHSRPPVQGLRGASVPVRLPPELAAAIRGLARRENVTPFMVVLAGFQVLLARLADQEDISVGAPVAGRTRQELEELVGFFVNTLVLRTRLDGNPSFAEVLRRVREVTLGAYAHQSVPFEKLVEELRPERDLSRTPLFQVMLAWQVAPLPELSLGELHVRPVEVETSTSKFELTLSLSDTGGAIEGTLEYDVDLFERSTAEAMVRRLNGLFEVAVRDPAGRIRDLPLLDADERHAQLATWNDTGGPAPLDTCFHRLFEAAVERTPDAIAVRAGARRTSFAELNRWANRWARALAAAGVGPDAVVGILDRRGDRFLAAMLAAFKAGGAYMPLDPDHPPARWAEMLGQAGPHLLLVASDLRERAAAALESLAPERRPLLVSLDDLPSAGDESNLPSTASAENLAYVLFTSGSTGAPKGVMIEQRGMVNHLFANIAALGLGPADTVAQTASVCFDISVWQFLVGLVTGGQVVIVPDDAVRDPRLLVELLDAEAITVFEPVPSVLAALLDECERIEPPPPLSSLRWVMPTGEALPDELCRRWFARYPSIPLINAYGPAECSDDVTFHVLDEPPAQAPPIGRPVLNMKVYVLARHQELLPVGVPGEIWIGGVGVGRGYARAPGLTAERFLPSPFASGERLYRTGDLGRLRPDGSIEYLGRADAQVKVRGHRIELGEVESALARHPGVREAAAAVRPDRRGQQSLVGYVVGRAGPAPEPADLRAFLREALPDYLVPSTFVALPALPRSANGKVERDALPAPSVDPSERADEPPRSPVEEAIAATWREVLGLDRVGIRDNFFELGGHSLLATQVTSRLRRSLGVDLPVRAVFEAPTVAELAARVEQALSGLSISGSTSGSPAGETAPLRPVSRRGPLPLSVAQTRLWFLEQLQPGTPLYNLPAAIRLRGRLDVASLERALSELLRRHEALRTTFPVRGDEPVQLIAPARPLPLPCVDLSGLPEEARMAAVERRAATEADTPFDLSIGPVVRARLLRLAGDDHVLLLTMHHIVSDEWSRGVLLREIGALYQSFADGAPAPLPDLPIQYGDYAVWQRERLTDDVLAGQIAYWREQLRGAPAALDLPTDFARPPVQSYRGATIRFHIPRDAAESMRRFCLAAGVTPFMALLAAFQVLMARYSGQDDISVGSATAGRSRPELEGLIGFFVNTLVLRARVSRALSFRELVAQVKEVTLGAYAHDELPFDRLVEELNPKRTLGRSPLFQVGLTLQNAPMPDVALPGLEVAPLAIETSTAKFDLLMALEETTDGIRGSIAYAADLFERETVVRLTEHYIRLLRDAVTRPDTRVGRLEMLTKGERRDLVRGRNQTRVVRAGERCVHELVEEQAAARPGAVAVEFGAERLTYAELDRRASSIAEFLASRGVGPEVRVGVGLGRSADLVAVLLGILKAGGAYVPLDPEHPEARLAAMIEDARPALVVAATSLPAGLSTAAVVSLDELRAVMRRDPVAPVARRAAPGNLAYVCFTSGSTGRPKGVAVEHRSVVNLVRGTGDVRVGPDQTSLLAARLTFDLAAFEIWSCLSNGGRLVVHPGRSAGDTDELGAILSRHRVTSLFLTSGHLAHVVDARPEILRGLDQLLTGGDVASAPHVRRVVEELGVPVVNCYGPTEATVLCASHRMTGDVGSTVPIGRPIDNTQIYVLDADLEPVPTGHPGELYVGGDGLARGYVGQAAATAERFVPDPFGPPGARLYRTGDLVRHGRGGALEFLGRSDSQVKIRGFRVEPGEVEAALLALPAVEQAVVVARPDAAVGRQLVAYVVTSDRAVDPASLRAALAERLPDYMVPSRFAALDALPLTANGKVDRDALPDPDEARPRDASVAPPRTQLERDLVAIWEELLGVSPIGIHDVFFELGGHSLLTVRLADVIQERLGMTVQVAALFEATTVEQLAAWIAQERAPGLERPLVQIEPGGEGTPLFCFHPVGGQVFAYAELARRMARSRPVYGLESAWEGGLALDLPGAAARYVAAMKSAQPRGPYFLAGWSSGGAVAFEVACQLEAAGDAAVLALLDAWSPEQMSSWLPKSEVLQLSSDLLHRGQVPRPVLDQIGQMARVVGAWADGLDPKSLAARFDTFRANVEALRTYAPGRFGGPVLEIQAPDEAGPVNLHGRAGRSRGWRELCQEPPEIAPVRGGHETMLQEPFVAVVVELLEERAALVDEPAVVADPPPRAEQG